MGAGLIGVSTGLKTFNKFPHVFSKHVVETFDFLAGRKVYVSFFYTKFRMIFSTSANEYYGSLVLKFILRQCKCLLSYHCMILTKSNKCYFLESFSSIHFRVPCAIGSCLFDPPRREQTSICRFGSVISVSFKFTHKPHKPSNMIVKK